MRTPSRQIYRIFACAAMLLVLHTLIRFFFWKYNHSQFPPVSFREGTMIFCRGVQQDIVSLLIVNSPLLFLLIIAAYLGPRGSFLYRISGWLFVGLNAAGLAINILDIGYYRFSRHRSSQDLLYVLGGSLGSFKSVITGYWYLLLLFAGVIFLLTRTASFGIPASNEPRTPVYRVLIRQVLFLIAILFLVGYAPGKFVLPSTPLLSVQASDLPIAQNSIFTFTYSILRKQHEVKPLHYFSDEELRRIVTTSHSMGRERDTLQRKNVVICILESFSRCYVMPGDAQKAVTPFFDSLIRRSIFFPNAHANAFESNQGIVAILGGLPAFLDEPFYYSEYANTPLRSIGNILKEEGYNTNFFMGAGRDHFGFGKFAHIAGIDHTYWQEDFGDDRYYDGNWGIFDEPFLQYGARQLAQKTTPFLAVFFNISSHYPYTIPEQYRQQFTYPGKTDAERSISYVDYAYRKFFETCRAAPWFDNTIFIFCADHWMPPDYRKTIANPIKISTIPIFLFDPSRDSGTVRYDLAGQVDLTPTILALLHYNGTYTGFGRNLLDSSLHRNILCEPDSVTGNYTLNKTGDTYQLITGKYLLGYDPRYNKTRYLFKYEGENLLGGDLKENSSYLVLRVCLERLAKANLQCYNQALFRRSLE